MKKSSWIKPITLAALLIAAPFAGNSKKNVDQNVDSDSQNGDPPIEKAAKPAQELPSIENVEPVPYTELAPDDDPIHPSAGRRSFVDEQLRAERAEQLDKALGLTIQKTLLPIKDDPVLLAAEFDKIIAHTPFNEIGPTLWQLIKVSKKTTLMTEGVNNQVIVEQALADAIVRHPERIFDETNGMLAVHFEKIEGFMGHLSVEFEKTQRLNFIDHENAFDIVIADYEGEASERQLRILRAKEAFAVKTQPNNERMFQSIMLVHVIKNGVKLEDYFANSESATNDVNANAARVDFVERIEEYLPQTKSGSVDRMGVSLDQKQESQGR